MRQNSEHNRPLAATSRALRPGRSRLHRHQQGTHLRYPLQIEPPSLGQRHVLTHRSSRTEVVPQLVMGAAEAGRRVEGPEAAHRVVPLLDAAMVLLESII